MSHFLEDECQGCHRNKEEPKTYCMVMKLCDECARVKKKFIRELTREKKIVFNCHKHPKLKALAFCEGHEETICLECQSSHIRRGCSLIDLNVEVAERRSQLVNLVERCKSRAEEFKESNVNVDIRSNQIEKHFALINDEIHNLASEERLEVEKNRSREAADINRHADDEVERIRQEQRESIMKSDREAKKNLVKTNEKEKGLVEKLAQFKAMFDKKISGMKSHLLQTLDSVETAESFDDESMLQPEFQRTVVSLTSVLNRQVDLKGVDKLVVVAESVSLLREYDGDERIDAPAERWEERSGLTWKTRLGTESYMMGAVNEGQVILKNKDDGSVHILNIHSGDTRAVISGKTPYDIYSCAALHDGRVVCGTRFGEVVVYDHAWDPLRVIHLDELGKSVKIRPVSICTDTNDLVLASNGEPTIHVFNPNNGEFIRSIDIKVRSICELHRLSSADIALRIRSIGAEECTNVRILDKTGYLRSKHHLHNKNVMSMAVDASRDRIFMLLLDHDNDVDEFDMAVLSPSGLADVDIDLPFDSRKLAEICFMPKTGSLIIHYDGTTAFFEKTEPGLEEIIDNID